ncbi:ABC transporter permease [Sinomonas sp. ASV322]|uniref:ABC transporter permease n=1 Tax=Sinomonas sp. ASV322 TaxID=3041920 RepID=UPI0027DBF4CB|nr:ABC transporter permease [Sinomonas sp. ASV322]MDQ4501605.1 ABC transporter permease [Sinomonas sp. ASV322]
MTETAASPMPQLGLTLRSLVRADATVLLRSRQALILNFVLPIIVLVVTNRGRFGNPGFLIGMAITYGLLSSALIGYSTTVARDREAGVFQRLRVSPTPTWAIMASRLGVQLATNLAVAVVVMVVGSIIHSTAFTAGDYLLILVVSLLGAAVFLSLGQALVGLVRSATLINAIGRVLYILLILTGILGSTGILGDDFKTFASWTPVGALINLYSAVLNLVPWGSDETTALIACLGYIVVFAGIGIRWFRWDPQ